MREKLTFRRRLSLTLFVSLCCAAIALIAVLAYSALSMEFFRMGIESIQEAQLRVAISGAQRQAPETGMDRIMVTEDAAALPPALRLMPAPGPGESGYHTIILDHEGTAEGIYCFLALPVEGKTWYAWQKVSQHEAETYIRPQVFSRIYTVLGVGGVILVLLLLSLLYMYRRIRRPATVLSRWAAQLDARTMDEPLPDLIYPELYAIAGMMRENLKKQYAHVRREELIWRYCSHELRTPISIINIGLDLLQKTLAKSGREAQQEVRVIARLQRATHSMSHLVTTLLWLGRNDGSPLKNEHIELSLFVGSIVSDFLKLFPGHGEQVRIRTRRHMALVPPPALRIVLENIIRNAFQHAGDGGICILQNGGRITVVNAMQGGNALSENTGFGLGLELTERLTARLGWEFSYRLRGRHARARLVLPA